MSSLPPSRSRRPLAARLVLALCLAVAVWWTAPAAAQQISLKHYGKAEGLSNLNATCLLQEPTGPIWVCTEDGLYRYDGDEFTRFGEADGLNNTLVLAAALDGERRLWVQTTSDLYLGIDGRFIPVRPGGAPVRLAEGVPLLALGDGQVATVVDGRPTVLRRSPAAMDGWTIGPLYPSGPAAVIDQVVGLYQDGAGRAWMGCANAICRVDPSGAVHVWGADEGVPVDSPRTFLLDSAGRLWARGPQHLVRLDPGARRFEEQRVDGLALTSAEGSLPMAEAPDGSVVLRTNLGLAHFSNDRWRHYAQANGLGADSILALLFDASGNLWMAPSGHGLSRWLGYGQIESWTTTQGFDSNSIWGLARLPGLGVVAGTRDSCYLVPDAGDRARPCPFDGLPRGELSQMLQAPDGRRWAVLRRGEVYLQKPGTGRFERVATVPKTTSAVLDRQGRLWLPSRGGIYRLDTRDGAAATAVRVGDPGVYLDAAEAADGAVWVVGSDGLRREHNGRWQLFPFGDARADPGFASIAIDRDGWLWAASRSRGLLHAHVQGDRVDRWEWIAHSAIASTGLMFVRLDRRGRVWAGTEYGVVVYDGHAWRRFTESDGLVWDDVDGNSFMADDDGSVWVGTNGGLSHFLRPDGFVTRPPLSLHIAERRFGGDHAPKSQPAGAWDWRGDAALDLRLASYCFDRSAHTAYRYRIAGVDHDWFETTSPRVHYPALPPGRYRFEAVMVDFDHDRSSPTIGYDIELRPPWWRTWWFGAALVATLGGATLLGYRWSVHRLQARHAVLQRELAERNLLLERATRDALTGLWNRPTIVDLLQTAIDDARRTERPLGVALIDVDHFKAVNDTYGHACGDSVLREIADRLRLALRTGDSLGRYGGEEFLLLMPALPKSAPAVAVERLRSGIADTLFEGHGLTIPMTASFGVSWLVAETDTADTLLERADGAMYRAKAGGRNRVVYG